ncbi:MAG: hypothetical protein MZU79_02935 [Anaerotruncus sp.]|nr:hypothetical protein [Anaerotruncus sp.]
MLGQAADQAERDPPGARGQAEARGVGHLPAASTKLLGWADKVRTLGIRANADIPPDAKAGLRLRRRAASACAAPSTCSSARTASPNVQRDDPRRQRGGPPRRRSPSCCRMQRDDFDGVFKAMHGEPGRPSARSTRRCTSSCPSAKS